MAYDIFQIDYSSENLSQSQCTVILSEGKKKIKYNGTSAANLVLISKNENRKHEMKEKSLTDWGLTELK